MIHTDWKNELRRQLAATRLGYSGGYSHVSSEKFDLHGYDGLPNPDKSKDPGKDETLLFT